MLWAAGRPPQLGDKEPTPTTDLRPPPLDQYFIPYHDNLNNKQTSSSSNSKMDLATITSTNLPLHHLSTPLPPPPPAPLSLPLSLPLPSSLSHIPPELLLEILTYLDIPDLLTISRTSHHCGTSVSIPSSTRTVCTGPALPSSGTSLCVRRWQSSWRTASTSRAPR